MSDTNRPSEDDLIARWFRPLATDPAAFGLVDDCAALSPPEDHDLVLKTDAVAAGIHFFHDDPWNLVAQKALRVNLSDLAAKGARPLGYLLSLALPADWRPSQLEAFSSGLAADQAAFGVALFGGDTIRSPSSLVVSITVLGAVPRGCMVRRAAARPGDLIYVSGTIGDSALGLTLRLETERAAGWGLDSGSRAFLERRYLLPEPRVRLAPAVLAHASAAMDVSDGLAIDLGRMCRGSGTTADVEIDAVPLSDAGRRVMATDPGALGKILAGGDDYEILAAVSPGSAEAFEAAAEECGVVVTRIGQIKAGADAPRFLMTDGTVHDMKTSGFKHF